MRFYVNDACIGCGLCVRACPAVFSMGADGKAQADKQDVTDEENALKAMQQCPVDAIEQA